MLRCRERLDKRISSKNSLRAFILQMFTHQRKNNIVVELKICLQRDRIFFYIFFQEIKQMVVISSTYLMEVHLCKHEVTREYHRLKCMKSSMSDRHNEIASTVRILNKAEALNEPLIIESSIV